MAKQKKEVDEPIKSKLWKAADKLNARNLANLDKIKLPE